MLRMQEFVYSVLKHWRALLVVALASAILGGAYYVVDHYKPKTVPAEEATDNSSIVEVPGVVLRTDWENAKDHFVLKLNYVCVGNEEAESDVILDAYKANLSGTQFLNHLKETCFTEEENLLFISQIVKVDNAAMANCLTVKCLYYDEDKISLIADVVDNYIIGLYSSMEAGLGDHRMLMVDSSVLEGYDEETEKWMDDIKSYVKTEKKVIAAIRFSFKDMIVRAFIFGMAGLFAAVIYILVRDSLGDKVYNVSQIKGGKYVLLGDLSYSRLQNKLDKFLYRLLIKRNNFSCEGVARLASLNLEKNNSYILIGKVSLEKLEEIKSFLAKEGINVSSKALLADDAEGVADFEADSKIIFVARRFEENCRDITEWIDTYSGIGVDMAGIMFI